MFTAIEKKYPFMSYRAPVLVYAALIFIISELPGEAIPPLFFLSFDKFTHILEFGLFGILLFRALRFPRPFKHPYMLTLAVGISYAAFDEIHQFFVPGRDCSLGDFAADVIGVVLFASISAGYHPVNVD